MKEFSKPKRWMIWEKKKKGPCRLIEGLFQLVLKIRQRHLNKLWGSLWPWWTRLALTLLSCLSLFAPPVSDSPSFSSAKLEEWSAINRTNFPAASAPLVSGVDKAHLEPEAKYTQVTNNFTRQMFSKAPIRSEHFTDTSQHQRAPSDASDYHEHSDLNDHQR